MESSIQELIFLDFDGVINNVSWALYRKQCREQGRPIPTEVKDINPMLVANLVYILEQCPNVKIVVSSTWRTNRTVEELRDLLSVYGVAKDKVLDKTPDMEDNPRGEVIRTWLNANPHPNRFFIILDDEKDMADFWPHLLMTDEYEGLSFKDAERCVECFQKHELPTNPLNSDRDFYWTVRDLLSEKMTPRESAAWLQRGHEDFGNKSPQQWVREQLESTAKLAWEKVLDAVKKIP